MISILKSCSSRFISQLTTCSYISSTETLPMSSNKRNGGTYPTDALKSLLYGHASPAPSNAVSTTFQELFYAHARAPPPSVRKTKPASPVHSDCQVAAGCAALLALQLWRGGVAPKKAVYCLCDRSFQGLRYPGPSSYSSRELLFICFAWEELTKGVRRDF